MGWSIFSERCMKGSINFKVRIERMHDDRWVKKVCEHVGERSKWLKTCKRAVRKCGLKCNNTNPGRVVNMWQLENAENEGVFWTYSVWKKVTGMAVQEYGLKKWKEGMRSKTLK